MKAAMPVRVACLGAGYFSRFHHDAWRRIDEVRLVGVADQDIRRAEDTGAPAFDDLKTMLRATRPDLLDIVTPPPTHLNAIRAALEAGVGAIICQKPFCGDLETARQAVIMAKQAGAVLLVHENFRFQPWYRVMAASIRAGDIGEVLQVTFRLRTGDGQGREAYLDRQPYFQTMEKFLVHETAVHWIDTFQFLLGPVTAVYADLRRLNPAIAGEDAGYVLFDFADNVRALFDGNRLLDHAAENNRMTLGEALIEGTQGTLALSGDGSVSRRQFDEVTHSPLLAARDWPGFAGDCVHALQKHVISGLLGDTGFENPAADYLRVMEIEDAIYRSAQAQRKLEI